jgi:hypothetical protein
MLFDLVVDSIVVPPGIRAPCPTTVLVVVRNMGPDPAPLPFDVCLQIVAFAEEPFSPQYSRRIESGEEGGGSLGPNQTVTAQFDLQFPCRPQAWVAAEVDCNLLLPAFQSGPPPSGHKRTQPQLGIMVPVQLVPWLRTDLRLGQQSSSGAITWGVSPLCPNIAVVAEVSVTNVGCANAPLSTTELLITGPSGVIASVPWQTGIAAGKTVTFPQHTVKPPLPSVLNVQACADTGGVVVNQCDTSGLCRSLSVPVSAVGAGSPFPFLDDSSVVPGEQPITSWSLTNDCSDLQAIASEVVVGSDTLYKTAATIGIAPLERVSEDNITLTVPPAAATTVWKVGQHSMEVHVTATGMPAKMWANTANLMVNFELSRSTFTWSGPTAATWKKVYFVAGTLTNTSAFTTLIPSAITITEATTTPGVTAEGPISVSAPAAPILLGAAAALTIPTRLQSWNWINPVTFQLSGPTAATFTYTATMTLTDGLGNVYPTPSLPVRTVVVAVSAAKIALQGQAAGELKAALAAFAAAVGVASGAAVFAALLWGLAIWHKGQADDPPVPDFRYNERVAIEPRRHEFPTEGVPGWTTALVAVVELLERARAAHEAMTLIYAKILGARADRTIDAWRLQTDDYRAALTRLQASAAEVPNAAAVAAQELRSDHRWSADQMAADLEAWRSGQPVDTARRIWQESGLPDDVFRDLEHRLEAVEHLTPLPDALIEIGATIMTLSEAITNESADALAPPDA